VCVMQDHSVQWITPLNAKSHGNLPPVHVVTNGFDPLRDVGHSYAQALQKDGTTVSFVHHEDMTHCFVQFTEKSKRCLQVTKDIGHVLRDAL
jgi:acetyl esterase